MKDKLPKKFIVPNPYDIPIHDQKGKNNCTSHAFATMYEFKLSELFKEQVLIDDLWEKQLKYGVATEVNGDNTEGVIEIANKHGMLFRTKSGRKGIFRPDKGIEIF